MLGYGYTASYFAQLLVREGYEVWGTSRDAASIQFEVPSGVQITDFNLNDISKYMLNTSCLLVSAPPTDSGLDPSLALLRELIISNKDSVQWIGYLSSTGVYGDHQGEWVDETSPCYAKTARTRNRLSAEKAWLSLYDTEGLPVTVFRLSGIYGPCRNALDRLRAGKTTTVFKKGQYFSRIHVADICSVLLQSILSPMPGEIINVSDDHPCGAHEVDQFAADLLQLERPQLIPYDQASLSPMAKEFYESNRRVSNAKLKHTILGKLRYPTYKNGLNAILSGENLA